MANANIKTAIVRVIHHGPKKDLLYLFSMSNLAKVDQTLHFLAASIKSKKKNNLIYLFGLWHIYI